MQNNGSNVLLIAKEDFLPLQILCRPCQRLSVMLFNSSTISINAFVLHISYYTYISIIMSIEIQNEGFVIHALIIRTPLFHVHFCFSLLISMCSKGSC